MEGGPPLIRFRGFPVKLQEFIESPRPYIVSRPPQPLPLSCQGSGFSPFEIRSRSSVREKERVRNERVAITFNGNGSGRKEWKSSAESRFEFFDPQRKSTSLSLLPPPPLFLSSSRRLVSLFLSFALAVAKEEGRWRKNISEIGYKEQTEKESI